MRSLSFLRGKRARRGIALELGITVMLVAVAMSVLLVTVAILQHRNADKALDDTKNELAVCEIGESFIKALAAGEELDTWANGLQGYTAETSHTTDALGTERATLTLKTYEGKTALFVAVEKAPDSDFIITAWDTRA